MYSTSTLSKQEEETGQIAPLQPRSESSSKEPDQGGILDGTNPAPVDRW
jgi:hypothetical protein